MPTPTSVWFPDEFDRLRKGVRSGNPESHVQEEEAIKTAQDLGANDAFEWISNLKSKRKAKFQIAVRSRRQTQHAFSINTITPKPTSNTKTNNYKILIDLYVFLLFH